MKRGLGRAVIVIASLALPGSGMLAAVEPAPTPALSQPAASPDGREIAFVADGDIWSVPAAGGDARLLVSGPATESRPLYSPDGRSLAFVSTRTGNGDIYILSFASGDLRRVTYDDGADELTAWSRDNQWVFRGMSAAVAARSVLGQRSLERPTVLVTNRVTLSDGEDFTEGYRALGLGKVVGEPTAGWIIYTSNAGLIDGSSVRLPFITITDADGKPMELHPRPVDVPVVRPLGESYQGKDSDLAAAVQTLLNQVEKSSQRQ